MTTPAIPSKPTSLSNLIETGSLVPDTTSSPTTPVNINAETLHIASAPKVRPQVPPKPEGLFEKPVTRKRAKTVSVPFHKESHDLTPRITPRQRHIPPPKPPRNTSSSELSDDRDNEEDDDEGTVAINDIPNVKDIGLCEEEYDLTPYQFNTDQAPTSNNLHNIISHNFAVRTMSYPQTSAPHAREQQIITPLQAPSKTTVEGYHEFQAKHLPLFKGMTLAELTKKYSKFFPFKIQITGGHYGTSSKYSISTDDRFNLHFMKNMKQLTIQAYGDDYFIPLSSAIQFGVVYDPNDNMTEALEGHIFRRVSDLIGTNQLPRLVRVMSACSCSNDVTLEYNELLVVKKVKRGLFKSKPMLKVFSLLTETKKLLPEEAIANFTTKPFCVKMDLSQFLKYVQKRFPIKAIMYYDREEDESCVTDEEELPSNLFTWPVMLKEVKKYKSLVATLEKGSQLIDIPLHGNIATVKANIVPPNSPADIEELFKTTESHLRNFDVTQIDTYGDFSTESAYDTQNTLYRMVRGSIKDLGIEVITPEALRKLRHHLQQETTDDCDEDSFTSSNSRGESPVYATLPWSDGEYQILNQVWPKTISSLPDPLENQTLNIDRTVPIPTPRKRADVSSSGSGVFRFSRSSSLALSNETKQRSVSLLQLPSTDSPSNDHEQNRKYIKSLSIAQVSSILYHC